MRVLIAEQDHVEYQCLLQVAAPQLELVTGEGAALAEQAASCPIWLGAVSYTHLTLPTICSV